MTTDPADSAFPRPAYAGQMTGGVSKREYSAMLNLASLLSHPDCSDVPEKRLAQVALDYTDALLELLNKDDEP